MDVSFMSTKDAHADVQHRGLAEAISEHGLGGVILEGDSSHNQAAKIARHREKLVPASGQRGTHSG